MKLKEAVEVLERHNKWRRGDMNMDMQNPIVIGIAIDTVVEYFKNNYDTKTKGKGDVI